MKKIFMTVVLAMSLVMTFISAAGASSVDAKFESKASDSSHNPLSVHSDGAYHRHSLQIGQPEIISQDESGTTYITLVKQDTEVNNSSTVSRAGVNKTETYRLNLTHENMFGQTVVGAYVDLECPWVSNGKNSYIKNLHGEYTIKNNNYRLSWNDDYKKAEDDYHSLGLDVTRDTFSETVVFDAYLIIETGGSPVVDLGWYVA